MIEVKKNFTDITKEDDFNEIIREDLYQFLSYLNYMSVKM